MTHNAHPSLEGRTGGIAPIDLSNLIDYADWKRREANIARANGDEETAQFFELQVMEMHMVTDLLVSHDIYIVTNMTLPIYKMKALTFDETRIEQTVVKEQQLQLEFSNNKDRVERVNMVLNNPAIRKEKAKFDERVKEVSEAKIFTEQDLFDTTDRSMRIIRSKILSMLGSGRRTEALHYIVENVMNHKDYDIVQAHRLLNALKDRFNIKEPRLSLDNTLDITDKKFYKPVPMGEWIYAIYKTGAILHNKVKGVDEPYPETAYGYMMLGANSQNDMLHNYVDQPLCRVHNVVRWRLATRYEIKEVIPQTKPVNFDDFEQ